MWQFVETVVTNHAPPPEGFTSILFVFTNTETGVRRSILSYLHNGYTEGDITIEENRIAQDLTNNNL